MKKCTAKKNKLGILLIFSMMKRAKLHFAFQQPAEQIKATFMLQAPAAQIIFVIQVQFFHDSMNKTNHTKPDAFDLNHFHMCV